MSEQNVQDENIVATEQNPMAQRVSLELKRREPNTVHNCARCSYIQGLTDEFINLQVLSIINVGLQSLAKFPALPNLRKYNRLSSGLENLEGCPNLSLLILAGNKFKTIDELKPLAKLPKLSILDLANCDVTSIDGYRETMFEILPQLKYLDNVDKTGVERDSDDEDEDDENAGSDEGDDDGDEEEEEYEEDESKTGLKALYNGTFEEGDDDEESYEGNEEEEQEESDEDDDLSEEDIPAGPIEGSSKGEKRKRNDDEDNVNEKP
ncbi:hypothetical protein I4U23_021481 [Adineta vaga]|nr:hypothetical protein I4U23_021481 [Adineta vaga]